MNANKNNSHYCELWGVGVRNNERQMRGDGLPQIATKILMVHVVATERTCANYKISSRIKISERCILFMDRAGKTQNLLP